MSPFPSRATQGVKLIRVDDGDEIAAITKLDEKEEDVELAETGAATTPEDINPATDNAADDKDDSIDSSAN